MRCFSPAHRCDALPLLLHSLPLLRVSRLCQASAVPRLAFAKLCHAKPLLCLAVPCRAKPLQCVSGSVVAVPLRINSQRCFVSAHRCDALPLHCDAVPSRCGDCYSPRCHAIAAPRTTVPSQAFATHRPAAAYRLGTMPLLFHALLCLSISDLCDALPLHIVSALRLC
jgi:hypothetical protein